jgi:hypothetical protein
MMNAQLKIWHRFKPGSKYTFEYSKTTTDQESGKISSNLTPFYLSIDKEDGGGIHGTWKIGTTLITGLSEKEKQSVEPYLNMHKDFQMKITLDKEGSLIAVDNYDECVAHVQSISSVLQTAYGSSEQVNQMIAQLSDDAESFLRAFFPEIKLYFDVYANTWSNGTYYIEEDITELAGLGSTLPFETKVTVAHIPSKKMEVSFDQVYNKLVLADAKNQFAGDPQPWFGGYKLPEDLELKISSKYSMNPISRMVESLEFQKSVTTGGKTALEEIKFVLKK